MRQQVTRKPGQPIEECPICNAGLVPNTYRLVNDRQRSQILTYQWSRVHIGKQQSVASLHRQLRCSPKDSGPGDYVILRTPNRTREEPMFYEGPNDEGLVTYYKQGIELSRPAVRGIKHYYPRERFQPVFNVGNEEPIPGPLPLQAFLIQTDGSRSFIDPHVVNNFEDYGSPRYNGLQIDGIRCLRWWWIKDSSLRTKSLGAWSTLRVQ